MTFFQLVGKGESLVKEKGSKFLGFAYPVKSEADVHQCLAELKKRYYDATHHCYAYIIGLSDQRNRSVDDSEPSHTAGDHILGQIRSRELTNTLLIVVRYYGGTNLGAGGLVAAYKETARLALLDVEVEEVWETREIEINYTYPQTPIVKRMSEHFPVKTLQTEFLETCMIKFAVPVEQVEALIAYANENGLTVTTST